MSGARAGSARVRDGDPRPRGEQSNVMKEGLVPVARNLGTVQDVTRQRRAERERLELLQASAQAESANAPRASSWRG